MRINPQINSQVALTGSRSRIEPPRIQVSQVRFQGKSDSKTTVYTVSQSPAEVMAKLKNDIDLMALGFWSTQGGATMSGAYKNEKGFVGEIEGNTFRLMKKRWYNHGSAPVLVGTMEATPEGTKITTRIDRLKSGKTLLRAYYGGMGAVSLVTLPLLIAQAAAGMPPVGAIVGLLAPVMSMAIMFGVETPLTRFETQSLKNFADKLFKK